MTTKIPLHIAISGHHPIFALGILKEILHSQLFDIKQIYSVGISSIIAPFVTADKIDLVLAYFLHSSRLDDLYLSHDGIVNKWYVPGKIRTLFNLLVKKSAYKGINTSVLKQLEMQMTDDDFDNLQKICVSFVDLTTGTDRIVKLKKDTWIDYVVASASRIGIIPPKVIHSHVCVDGGYNNTLPSHILQDLSAITESSDIEELLLIHHQKNIFKKTTSQSSILDLYSNVIKFMIFSRHNDDLDRIQKQMKSHGLEEHFSQLTMNSHISVSPFEIDPVQIKLAYNDGRVQAKHWITRVLTKRLQIRAIHQMVEQDRTDGISSLTEFEIDKEDENTEDIKNAIREDMKEDIKEESNDDRIAEVEPPAISAEPTIDVPTNSPVIQESLADENINVETKDETVVPVKKTVKRSKSKAKKLD